MSETILGKKVRDTVTGFEGTATGVARYVSGNESVEISTLIDGKVVEQWFSKGRVEIVS